MATIQKEIRAAEFRRGIFKNIDVEDAIKFSTNTYKQIIPDSGKISNKIVRAIMLEKNV